MYTRTRRNNRHLAIAAEFNAMPHLQKERREKENHSQSPETKQTEDLYTIVVPFTIVHGKRKKFRKVCGQKLCIDRQADWQTDKHSP